MCQQTRVATVIPYYERWMREFPTVRALAGASEDDVFRFWQGLGYYSRARNIRRAAIEIVEKYQGKFPNTVGGLKKLPGIGQYTASAIASIAFNRPVGVVDGNVLRVLARFYEIHDDIRVVRNTHQFWGLSDAAVDMSRPGDSNQALMELGALLCTPKSPRCDQCPVSRHCSALRNDSVSALPYKSPKPKPRVEHRFAFRMVRSDGALLVARNPAGSLLGGMWQFPMLLADDAAAAAFAASSGTHPGRLDRYAPIKHVFSHIQMHVTLLSGTVQEVTGFRGYEEVAWMAPEALSQMGTSKLMKKIQARYRNGQSQLKV